MRPPNNKSDAANWVLSAMAVASLIPLLIYYRTVYPSPDQALFDYLAWMNIHGRTFYSQGFEQNWPGALILHEIATRLFGVAPSSFRSLDFLLMVVATGFVAWHFLRRNLLIAGWLFAFTYPVIYATSGRWMAGERDAVAMNLLLIAVVLLLHAEPPGLEDSTTSPQKATVSDRSLSRLSAVLSAGALISFSMLIRPTYLFFAAAVGGVLLVRAIRKQRLAIVMRSVVAPGLFGFVSAIAIIVVAGLAAGNLDDWYAQTITFNLETYQVVESRWRLGVKFLSHLRVLWPWLTPIAAIGLLSLKDARLRPELRYGIALLSTVLVSFVAQNKGFGYHLGGLIPLLTLAVAMGLDTCIHWAKQGRKIWLVPAFLAGSLLVAGLTSRLQRVVELTATKDTDRPDAETERKAIVAILRCETGPRDLVFQWGRLSDILYLAERLPASRLVSTPALNLLTGERGHEWTNEFARDLQTNKARMIVIDDQDLPLNKIRAAQSPEGLSEAARTLLDDLRANYEIRFAGEQLTLFQRRGVPRLRQCS